MRGLDGLSCPADTVASPGEFVGIHYIWNYVRTPPAVSNSDKGIPGL